MKIFLTEIYCLLLFDLIVKNEKKCFVVCAYKHFYIMCISVFNVMCKLRLVGLNIYFSDVFFVYKMVSKWVQKGVYRNEVLFLL